jgi:hypothetical protein
MRNSFTEELAINHMDTAFSDGTIHGAGSSSKVLIFLTLQSLLNNNHFNRNISYVYVFAES